MRTLLMLSAAALLAGSMTAYAADPQASDEALGAVPGAVPAARAEVPKAPTSPAPGILYKAPDFQEGGSR